MSDHPHRLRGFPAGAHATVIPNLFFSDVLPEIEDPAELLVTAYAFFAVGRRPASERWLTLEQLGAEGPLLRSLDRLPGRSQAALARGLAAAVARGTIVRGETAGEERYAINSPAGRRALSLAAVTEEFAVAVTSAEPPPNIYALYEETIGTISPLIADELRAAEEEYPQEWIDTAFREAAAQNRRSWRYVARILERWRDEGRHDAAVGRDPGARRDLAGRYRGLIHR